MGVWAAPGAPETLQNDGGRSPPPFGRVSGAPGAAQTPKMTDFLSLVNFKFRYYRFLRYDSPGAMTAPRAKTAVVAVPRVSAVARLS